MSPDGHAIVSGGDDRTVRLWNADTGTSIGIPLTGHTDAVTSVAFSPDGRLVVSSPDATLRLWAARASTDDLCDKLTANMSHKQSHDWVAPNIGSQRLGPKADQWEEGSADSCTTSNATVTPASPRPSRSMATHPVVGSTGHSLTPPGFETPRPDPKRGPARS